MTRSVSFLILAGLLASTAASSVAMRRAFPWPYAPYRDLITTHTGLQDAAVMTAGFRATASDIAWVQLLQYVGGWILPDEDRPSEYRLLKDMTLRVTRIDPFYRRAYLYSAAMLAFFNNIHRPQEAVAVLREGIAANPQYWPLQTMAAAVAFQEQDNFEPTARLLEEAIQHPDCPALTKSILANAYKTHGRPQDAARIWRLLLNDPNYGAKARQELAGLQ